MSNSSQVSQMHANTAKADEVIAHNINGVTSEEMASLKGAKSNVQEQLDDLDTDFSKSVAGIKENVEKFNQNLTECKNSVNGINQSLTEFKTTVNAELAKVVPVTKGGTGKTTGRDAINAFINELELGSSIPSDADYYVCQWAGGGTSVTKYTRRPVSKLLDYIKPRILEYIKPFIKSTQRWANVTTFTAIYEDMKKSNGGELRQYLVHYAGADTSAPLTNSTTDWWWNCLVMGDYSRMFIIAVCPFMHGERSTIYWQQKHDDTITQWYSISGTLGKDVSDLRTIVSTLQTKFASFETAKGTIINSALGKELSKYYTMDTIDKIAAAIAKINVRSNGDIYELVPTGVSAQGSYSNSVGSFTLPDRLVYNTGSAVYLGKNSYVFIPINTVYSKVGLTPAKLPKGTNLLGMNGTMDTMKRFVTGGPLTNFMITSFSRFQTTSSVPLINSSNTFKFEFGLELPLYFYKSSIVSSVIHCCIQLAIINVKIWSVSRTDDVDKVFSIVSSSGEATYRNACHMTFVISYDDSQGITQQTRIVDATRNTVSYGWRMIPTYGGGKLTYSGDNDPGYVQGPISSVNTTNQTVSLDRITIMRACFSGSGGTDIVRMVDDIDNLQVELTVLYV